ncbi:nitronate monooxygenase [Kurthia gibsonii]|uniref:NAD(P)H-dependent flavin oxidoreductase n=1 Tax=Kurthia gibsonii TaxID=33946 RepID=UPI000EAF70E8|nr:nitronate monooxygenase [Kurthia gibsonii]RXH52906.1 nitronate monooxygenase [Kurthia gibsonii]
MHLHKKLSMNYPIIQAPMAGVTTPEMVIASLETGILGSIGAGYMSADATRDFIRQVKKYSSKPFLINLFAHEVPPVVQHEITIAKQALIDAKIDNQIKRDEVKLSKSQYDEQLAVVLEEGVAACSFTFGVPTPLQIRLLREKGILVFITATSLEEVHVASQLGVDGIFLQGMEAGGHRGSFIEPFQYISLKDLFTQAKDITNIPLIVAGGIATKEQMDWYLKQGAEAITLGTALLVSDESGAPSAHKERILCAETDETVLTKMFSGKPARGIMNGFIEKMEMMPVAPFPYQNDLTKGIRARAAFANNSENMSLWAGTNLHHATKGTIREIIERFVHADL